MSYEESYRHRRPCPCGDGEYEEVGFSGDWGSTYTERSMLCVRCAPDYVWSHTSLGGHKWNEAERGWVRRAVVDAEERYPREVTERLRKELGERWRQALVVAPTKRAKWELLTTGGKGYPALGTFYQHTKGMDADELSAHLDQYLSFHYIGRVEQALGVRREDFGVRSDQVCEVCGADLALTARGDLMCRSCRYIRPRPGF